LSVTYGNRNNIKATGGIGQSLPRQVIGGHRADSGAFSPGNRLGWRAEPIRSSGLDLDEHDGVAVPGDDVNLASARTVAARNDCVPAPLELPAGEIFAGFPKENTPATVHARIMRANGLPEP
jgi:hypothetical protein